MYVNIQAKDPRYIPQYKTEESAGCDLVAAIDQPITIMPLQRIIVPTGIRIELPRGYEAQVRSRSGLSLKHGIIELNAPGTIDSDYRGELGSILINLSDTPYTIQPLDSIGQLVIARHEHVEWVPVIALTTDTDRGEGGFGSTGR